MAIKPKIVIAAVMYSPNLGDGIIADCIKSALSSDMEVAYLDLAGRPDFLDVGHIADRALLFRLIDKLPESLRDYLLSAVLGFIVSTKLITTWREAIKDADAIILGGGQLLSSGHMNFPNKLQLFLRECDRQNKPVAIYSVGVGGRWSELAEKKFLEGISRKCVTSISVRDHKSLNKLKDLNNRMGFMFKEPNLTLDPGVLCSRAYRAQTNLDSNQKIIGFNIISPHVLETVSNNLGLEFDFEQYNSRLKEMIIRVSRDQDSACLYTNGAFEDEAYKNHIFNDLSNKVKNLKCLNRPKRPEELALIISKLTLNIAHRLHSSIVAYSYGVPIIGLTWSEKVESFFKSVDLDRYYFDGLNLDVEAIVNASTAAPVVQYNEKKCELLQEMCLSEIGQLSEGFGV